MGTLENLGYLKQAALYSCAQPSALLMIEAAAKPAAVALMQAATFGCNDIVKMRAGISPWHARNLNTMIKKAIPAEHMDQAGKLLKFTLPVEKALFFFFVVDLTTEFFANWQSQVFQLGGCGTDPDTSTASGSFRSYVEPHPGNWARIAYNFTFTGPIRGSLTDFGVPAGYTFSCTFSLQVKPLFPNQPVGSVQVRLRQAVAGGWAAESEPGEPPWIGNQVKAGIMVNSHSINNFLRGYVFEAMADAVCVGMSGHCSYTISKFPVHQMEIIPSNCLSAAKGLFNS